MFSLLFCFVILFFFCFCVTLTDFIRKKKNNLNFLKVIVPDAKNVSVFRGDEKKGERRRCRDVRFECRRDRRTVVEHRPHPDGGSIAASCAAHARYRRRRSVVSGDTLRLGSVIGRIRFGEEDAFFSVF